MIDVACAVKAPTIKNGIPSPSPYVNNRAKALLGVVNAKVKIAPSIAPTQGVHPTANVAPKINEVKYA